MKFPRIPMPKLPSISTSSRNALAAAGVGTGVGGVGGTVVGHREAAEHMYTPQEVQYAYRKGQVDMVRAIRSRQSQMGARASSMPKSASARAQYLKKIRDARKAKMNMPYGSKVPYPTPGAPSTPGIPGLPAGRNLPGATPPISPAGRSFPSPSGSGPFGNKPAFLKKAEERVLMSSFQDELEKIASAREALNVERKLGFRPAQANKK